MYKIINIIIIVITITIMFFTCCNKTGDEYGGTAIALKNGTAWKADCIAGYSNQFPDELYILMHTFSKEGFLRENLHIGRIIPAIGIYTIEKAITDSTSIVQNNYYSSFATVIDDGDVLDDFFVVLESAENFLEITHIDLNKKIIQGKFNVNYILSDTVPSPDTIHFTGGEFRINIKGD